MKARISSGSLTPGADSTPEETSTPPARVIRSASATLSAVSPPDTMNGSVRSRSRSRVPVEGGAEPARTGRALRRAGVEQDAVGDRRVVRQRREIVAVATGSAFITGRPKRALDLGDARRRSRGRAIAAGPAARVSTMAASRASSASTVSATTLAARPARPGASSAAVRQVDMARRGGKEHEAHHVGAGRQRRIERRRGSTGRRSSQRRAWVRSIAARRNAGSDRGVLTTSRCACLARRRSTEPSCSSRGAGAGLPRPGARRRWRAASSSCARASIASA